MKRAFTLIELMLAILLGAMVVLMIAGCLRAAINAWEAVERTSAENYNHRTVLDLIKRQSSSLFYAEDGQALNNQGGGPQSKSRYQIQDPKNQGQKSPLPQKTVFELPKGANYFKGAIQQIEFVSTVSFLSDFPGQVSVKYYVVQEESSEMDSNSQSLGIGAAGPPPPPPETINENGEESDEFQELEGNLYLIIQETNLFMSQAQSQDLSTAVEPDEGEDESGEEGKPDDQTEVNDVPLDELLDEDSVATSQVRLLGPLRKFSIRYRIPDIKKAEGDDEDSAWETSWDVNAESGKYPSAIEFTLFYETPGITDDVDTEELDGIRMVIPIYSSNNLNQRGNNHASFFDQ